MQINTVYNEDNLKTLEAMPDDFIDLVVTSPPYGDARDYSGFEWDLMGLIMELYDKLKKGGVIVWVVNDQTKNGSESGESFRQALSFMGYGFNLHDTMIWEKPNFSMPSTTRYHQLFEYMFIFSKGKPKTFNPICDKPNKYKTSFSINTIRKKDGTMATIPRNIYSEFGMRGNVWKMNTSGQERPCKKIEHPATFSEILAHDHIISWSNPGDLVYDPFMGSGTVAKVAKDLERNWIGSEISSDYCKIIESRLK
jgi:site-specific DNA-methyltransferase (adenine-specific)